MNTMSIHTHPLSLAHFASTILARRDLLFQLVKRDVAGRYRGSLLGLFWTLLNPLFLLAVYTFVFTVVFKARWGALPMTDAQDTGMYAVIIFCGLMVHLLLAECLIRSPSIILQNENFVKKVIFPLELFPTMLLLSGLFHQLMYLLILLVAVAGITGTVHPTAFYLPLIWMPYWIFLLGVSLMLASLGVYIRDIGQMIQLVVTVMLFLSPIFYPVSSLPDTFQHWLMLNPLTLVIEQTRDVLLWGKAPAWNLLSIYMGIALACLTAGYAWFQKTRKGFADVL